MKSIGFLALTLCAALPAPSFAATFVNNWSFVDTLTGQTVSGTISGLVNGTDLSADGLLITVTQAPYSVMLGTYDLDLGAGWGFPSEQDSYSAANGVVTFANFYYSNQGTENFHLGTNPLGGTFYPEIFSDTGVYVQNRTTGVQFSAITASVPEPASWAMLVAGFGLAGAAMRRRSMKVRYA